MKTATGNARFDRGLRKVQARQTMPAPPTAEELAQPYVDKRRPMRTECMRTLHRPHQRRHNVALKYAAFQRDLFASMHTLGTIAAKPKIIRRVNR